MVALRPLAIRAAVLPAAKSIWAINQPPKISPAGFVSAGIAIVLMAGSWLGNSAVVTSLSSFNDQSSSVRQAPKTTKYRPSAANAHKNICLNWSSLKTRRIRIPHHTPSPTGKHMATERMDRSWVALSNHQSDIPIAMVEIKNKTPIAHSKSSLDNCSERKYITPGTDIDPVMPVNTEFSKPRPIPKRWLCCICITGLNPFNEARLYTKMVRPNSRSNGKEGSDTTAHNPRGTRRTEPKRNAQDLVMTSTNDPVFQIWMILVKTVGTKINIIAVGISEISAPRPIPIVGKPKPTVPLTKPAKMKIRQICPMNPERPISTSRVISALRDRTYTRAIRDSMAQEPDNAQCHESASQSMES